MSAKHHFNKGLKLFFAFWEKYHELDNFHYQWAKDHLKVLVVKRGDVLEPPGHRTEISYFVATGMLARAEDNSNTSKRKITSLALPNMALMSTVHLHSHSIRPGEIIALRPGIIIALPHHVLRRFQEYEKSVDTLVDVFCNKEKRQLILLQQLLREYSSFDRYLSFVELMPEIRAVTSQTEQAALLDISRNTIQRASYFLATRKIRRK
ncbi:hypothetical protein [Sphingobacterium sp.]|uniref:hypothetical protein n=1 Tax=Sphingobacterium sp. TaxID=341027 RepID=UPI0031CE219A